MKKSINRVNTHEMCFRSIWRANQGDGVYKQRLCCLFISVPLDPVLVINTLTAARHRVKYFKLAHMPDNHYHHNEGCGHESHDHDHDSGDVGPNDNLFQYIDRPHVVALNTTGPGSSVIKPWHERTSEDVVRDRRVSSCSSIESQP